MFNTPMGSDTILNWLFETDPTALTELWKQANKVREKHVGNEIHLRGLIEVSSYCVSGCTYCGLFAGNKKALRYRMSQDEVLDSAKTAENMGYGSIVLQSGEDLHMTASWIAEVISRIKAETSCAITLSFGERETREWELWRKAGADRYLLRFESSNQELFQAIHPGLQDRISQLPILKRMGYQVGSGVMIGIPAQSYEILAKDIQTFSDLDLDMIGVGPYLPHPDTPLGKGWKPFETKKENQVPNSIEMTCKVIALARINCPDAHIPSTTALATLGHIDGRIKGLMRGANVIMPNVTPSHYREQYTIYPGKNTVFETAKMCRENLENLLSSIGRFPAVGPGHRCDYNSCKLLV